MRDSATSQRVGILNALTLFMGLFVAAVLSSSNLFAWIAFTVFAYGVWAYARARSNTGSLRSFIDGFLFSAAVLAVARIFGWVASLLIFNESRYARGVDYKLFDGDASDLARVLLDGGWGQSLVAVIALAVLAATATMATGWLSRGGYLISDVDQAYNDAYIKVPLAATALALLLLISAAFISDSSTEARLGEFYEEAYVNPVETVSVPTTYSQIETAIDARTAGTHSESSEF